jgi:DNA-binding transcriptional MerR regulator
VATPWITVARVTSVVNALESRGLAERNRNLYENVKVWGKLATVTVAAPSPAPAERLLRIQEVSEDVGLTPRSIRYYEERGLLKPVARSEGAYRLYDADDIERLRFIKGLRDDAGFSLSDIGLLLEDETARARIGARFRETTEPAERRALLVDGIARIDHQIEILRSKIARLESMIDASAARRRHLQGHLDELDGKVAAAPGHEPRRAAR